MTQTDYSSGELQTLIDMVCDNAMEDRHLAQLEQLLSGNAEAQKYYLEQLSFDRRLRWVLSHQDDEMASPSLSAPIIATNTFHSSLTYFSSGWPVAYLIATVIFAIGAVVGASIRVSEPAPVALDPRPTADDRITAVPTTEHVGMVTGMVNCVFQGAGEGTRHKVQGSGSKQLQSRNPEIPKSLVSLGDTYSLASGLLEITYNSGAKVILQGPVTFEVASKNGGFLSIGKLTGKVETNKVASGQWTVASEKQNTSAIRNSPSAISHPSLSTIHQPLFTVTTPTAIVTDLGTEFGVEVDKRGSTTSHVFRGSVRVQQVGDVEKPEDAGRVLHENESAQVEYRGGKGRIVMLSSPAAGFVRELPRNAVQQKTKLFDLVDAVAGGDGFSGRRNRGIDSTDGRIVAEWPAQASPWPMSDGRYHRVEGHPMVDGIFVPCPRLGPVQVDSAGHTFADCPETDGDTSGVVWAGGAPMSPLFIPPTKLGAVDYGTGKHGFLFLHANKGITFDLDAIRRCVPDCRLTRFRSEAGNTETASNEGTSVFADFHVLVDGEARFKRRQFSSFNEGATVAVAIADSDRFLTLVATGSNDGIQYDWIVFGDPRLELEAKPVSKSTLEQK